MPECIAIQLGVVALRRGLLVVVLQGAAFQWWIQVKILTDSFADIGVAVWTQCRQLVGTLSWSEGLQNAKPDILFVISWMLLVYFVILVICAAKATLEGASEGGDRRAIKPPIIAENGLASAPTET